jgi:peptidyl-prolyl cis-trans isomerase C/peptidyl-prolyl cis-trans isomerase SurA
MKSLRSIIVLALALAAALPLRADTVDGVKAIVNDTVITYGQIQELMIPAVDSLRRQYSSQPDLYQQKIRQVIDDTLEQLIERQLILHEFEVKYTKLPDSVVDGVVQDRIRDKFGDRITLTKTLQAQGMTFEQFRNDVRDQYIESALRHQNVSQNIVISPYKVETYYLAHQDEYKVDPQIKLRMIMLNKSSSDDTNTVALAREIRGKIKEGATFQEMSAIYSQSSQEHPNGNWGWVERSILRKELADAAANMKAGEISDVVETSDACYIMLVEDTHPAQVRPLDEVRKEIEKTLTVQEQSRLQKEWIDGLKKKTFIRLFDS